MNPSPIHPADWNRGRLAVAIGAVFLLQAGLLWLVGARQTAPSLATPPGIIWRLASPELSKPTLPDWLWAGDPTLFVVAGPNGFSGGAWMNQPPRDYELPGFDEPPRWLALNPDWLGPNLQQLTRKDVQAGHLFDDRRGRFDATEILLPPLQVSVRSSMRLDDSLKARLEGPLPSLPSWPSNDVIPNSLVLIAVDGTGAVIAVRLLRSSEAGSGLVANRTRSVEADQLSLRIANGLRFRPVNSGPDAFEPVWGNLTFEWASDGALPAATNAVSSLKQ
ncbi:MAG: hypothetical protein H7X97_05545 [Opitutaceae bacterium]|nr:hypothetical protein [Verrucomicrobiales bacterium]